jgi:hypothetical protein
MLVSKIAYQNSRCPRSPARRRRNFDAVANDLAPDTDRPPSRNRTGRESPCLPSLKEFGPPNLLRVRRVRNLPPYRPWAVRVRNSLGHDALKIELADRTE